MRQAEALRGDRGTEVRLVADDRVRPPLRANVQQRDRLLARQPLGEAVAEVLPLALDVDGLQRDPPPRRRPRRLGREDGDASRGERLERRGPSGVRDRVAGRRGGILERDERVEVTGAPDEGEEDAHAGARGLAPGDLRVGRPQHHVDEQPDERDDEHDDRPGGLAELVRSGRRKTSIAARTQGRGRSRLRR